MKYPPTLPMTRPRARLIVSAATTADLANPAEELSAALKFLRSHPDDWTAWLQEHQRDQVIACTFGTIGPPPGLRNQILAAQGTQHQAYPRRRFVLAWAASLALVAGSGIAARWILGNSDSRVADPDPSLASAASHFLDREWDHVFDHTAGTLDELRHFLEGAGEPGSFDPGDGFNRLSTIGCRRFSWKEQVAVLICFRASGDGTIVHVISVPRAAVGPEIRKDLNRFREGRWHAASWIRGEHAYVALSSQPLDPGHWSRAQASEDGVPSRQTSQRETAEPVGGLAGRESNRAPTGQSLSA